MDEMDFLTIDGTIVCKIPDRRALDWEEIQKIAQHTVNTWQQNRAGDETLNNTAQGKMAEYVLEQYLKAETNVRYLSYDRFRADKFEKHAPFDGLLYSADIDSRDINERINEVNIEVQNNPSGQISEELRERLEDYKIFTLEIKSSQLRNKDYQGVEHVRLPRNTDDYRKIIENIRKWDYFVYPHYTRRSDSITSFYEYAEFVRRQDMFTGVSNQNFLRALILKEFNNASDIYTRLYFDYKSKEIFIPGYVRKEDFFHNPKIGKMPGGKSGMALYYMRSISMGSSFAEINNDGSIWDFDRMSAYADLFAYQKRRCPNCGKDLQICNAKSRHTYSYLDFPGICCYYT